MGFQAFFIMAGVLRILPFTGITLPFMAYGGSSLFANYLIVALLLRISRTRTPRERRGGEIVARRVRLAGSRVEDVLGAQDRRGHRSGAAPG